MNLNMRRIITGIVGFLLCAAFAAAAAGEAQPVDTVSNGRVTQTEWLDENGQPAAGPEGYAAVKYSYKNTAITEMYFDAEGKPFEHDGGYYGRRVDRDGKGNVTEIAYLDMDGTLRTNIRGYALVTMNWTGAGMTRLIYKDESKKKVTVPSLGYASVTYEYNGSFVKTCTYLDAKDKPVDCAEGYAYFRQNIKKVAGRYAVLSSRYDHADGSPATGPDGWFRCVKDRDDKGRVISVKYYDVRADLTDRGMGYAWEGYVYEGANIVMVTRYGLDDQPAADAAGVVTLVREMDGDRVMKEQFLDQNGNRICTISGAAEIRYTYDEAGNVLSALYFDMDGNQITTQ